MRRSRRTQDRLHQDRRGGGRSLGFAGFLLLATVWGPIAAAEDASKIDAAEFLQVAVEGRPGGRVSTALRAEPSTFNPIVATDAPSFTVIRRMTADLIHINRGSQEVEPALARDWKISEDGRTYRIDLRRGIRFSDGHELDADDVVFTFRVYLDEAVASPHRHLLTIAEQPITIRRLDRYAVELKLAEPYAVGVRLFDSIPILPQHVLEKVYAEGEITKAWSTATSPEELVGLGPFRLASYVPGERLVLKRNPHYWKVDPEGRRLPYLDELVFVFVPDEDAQLLRFQAGDIDLIEGLDAESFAVLEREKDRRGAVLEDLGAGLVFHYLFFNLNDLDAEKLPEVAQKQTWLRNPAFRRAIDAAIDRRSVVRLVYRGRASLLASPVSAGNKLWLHPELKPTPTSLERARALLREGGFSWDDEGRLLDAQGAPVQFTIVTNSSNDERVRIASILAEDLRRLGMAVQAVPIEFRALVARVTDSFDYELCILGASSGDVDPNGLMNFMMSGGSNHLWRFGDQPAGSEWQKEIDELLREQIGLTDAAKRRAHYLRVQELFAEHLPVVPLVTPNVLAAADRRIGNFRPAVLQHSTLWNVDELYWQTSKAVE